MHVVPIEISSRKAHMRRQVCNTIFKRKFITADFLTSAEVREASPSGCLLSGIPFATFQQ